MVLNKSFCLRQGSLCLEETWNTHTWQHRIFATVFGIICTDAFLAYRYDHKHAESISDYTTFMGRLAHQLIFNSFITSTGVSLRKRKNDTEVAIPNVEDHVLKQLVDLPQYQSIVGTRKRARIRCKVNGCSARTAYYCSACKLVQGEAYGICSATKSCYAAHICGSICYSSSSTIESHKVQHTLHRNVDGSISL